MQRSRRVWLAGPLMMIVFTAVISLAARLTGTSSPIMVFLSPSIAFAVAWILAWDSAADATEFAGAYASVLDVLPFPASVTELPSGEILVAHASDDALLDQVESIAGG